MKTILAVVGIGMLAAPAIAGSGKRTPVTTKPISLARAAKPIAAKPAEAPPNPAPPVAAMPIAIETAAPEVLDIPVLPADPSSALYPLPELDRRPLVSAKPIKPVKPAKAKAPVANLGASYVLGGRHAAKPEREVEQIIPKSLSQAQVATVVQHHMGDIHNCWELVPRAQRADVCTAMLRLSISDAGNVTDIEIGGDVPAGAHKCIASAIARWTFPAAETTSDVEYGIALRSL